MMMNFVFLSELYLPTKLVKRTMKLFNPIPTGCCHVTLIYGLIPLMAGRSRIKPIKKGTFIYDNKL